MQLDLDLTYQGGPEGDCDDHRLLTGTFPHHDDVTFYITVVQGLENSTREAMHEDK